MNKIGQTIGSIVLLAIVIGIVVQLVPALKEAMFFLIFAIWSIFKEFFWQDVVKEYGIYIGLFLVVSIVFGYVSKKTENILWNLASLICAVAEFVIYLKRK